MSAVWTQSMGIGGGGKKGMEEPACLGNMIPEALVVKEPILELEKHAIGGE